LWRSLQVRVRWLPVRSLPKQAWSEEFRRYRAERLCRFLASVRPDWASRIVGWTWEDISTTLPGVADQAVFGLADRGGPAAMLSGFRLRRLSSLSSMERAWDALLVHEAGHLLSLGHCVSKRCVMRDCAGSLRCLVGLRRAFCRACRHVLKR
jgi:predicted Zn-dependent protease